MPEDAIVKILLIYKGGIGKLQAVQSRLGADGNEAALGIPGQHHIVAFKAAQNLLTGGLDTELIQIQGCLLYTSDAADE